MDINQQFEKEWWGSCQNTLGEEMKQLAYAQAMGITFHHNGKSPYNISTEGKKILDIGGGPVSLLLKCDDVRGTVIDPCPYPQWVEDRYRAARIDYVRMNGEDIENGTYDEVWIYNVLQHVIDPEKILRNARRVSKLIRIFEWVGIPTTLGHPHTLNQKDLDRWLGGSGRVEYINQHGAKGYAYYGIFKGDLYE